MTTAEIKKICLDGSKRYYKYLSNKKNGGVEEIVIHKIEKVDSTTFKLAISKKLFDTETLSFRYDGEVRKTFTGEAIQVKLYDNDKRILIVRAKGDAYQFFSKGIAKDWKLIIDLKFLVQRVIDWYEENGNDLVFNFEKMQDKAFNESVILSGSVPSEEQQKALKTIFSNRVSYIWGAPGTGKTKFVLSYALLHYLKKNQKVFVLAPTNVALEQIFNGVIEVTDQAEIGRNKILRLGFPTKEFADKYGEVCEVLGLEKELKKLTEKIKILAALLGVKSEGQRKIEDTVLTLQAVISINDEIEDLNLQIRGLLNSRKEIEKTVENRQVRLFRLKKEEKEWIRKKTSLVGRLLNTFLKNIDFEVELDKVGTQMFHIEKEISKLNSQSTQIKKGLAEVFNKQEERKKKIESYQATLKQKSYVVTEIAEAKSLLSKLKEKLEEEKGQEAVFQSLAKEYENYTHAELLEMYQQAMAEKERLQNYSLENRLKSTLLVGATLDTYLHRFKEKKSNAQHIFIDEAGYASVVKALTAFTENIPITFLGDHQQLPPVCEVSKSDIKKEEDLRDVFVWDQSAIFVGEFIQSKNQEEALSKYLKLGQPSRASLPRASLTKSFRFGPNLAKTLEQYVYSDGFSANGKEDTEIIIVNVRNPSQWRKGKRLNEAEAQAIKEYVLKNHGENRDVAILAPYRDQVNRINNLLPEFKDENKILTVHKSQGKEWETVIYSVCDIGNGKRPWFTDTTSTISNGLNNVNTAVSRAKKRLVLFCSKEDWIDKKDQLIAGLLKASTKEITIDFPEQPVREVASRQSLKPSPSKKKYSNESGQIDLDKKAKHIKTNGGTFSEAHLGPIRDKYYKPSKPEEIWQSKTLIWSVKELPGFKYSAKKNAYWKKK